MKTVLVRVVAPHFVAGVIYDGSLCIEAAPILKRWRGKYWRELKRYAQRKGWELQVRR